MKKLLLLLIFCAMLIACTEKNQDGSYKISNGLHGPRVEVIDSCEYVIWGRGLSHKGNCKFCKERMHKEFKKIIEEN